MPLVLMDYQHPILTVKPAVASPLFRAVIPDRRRLPTATRTIMMARTTVSLSRTAFRWVLPQGKLETPVHPNCDHCAEPAARPGPQTAGPALPARAAPSPQPAPRAPLSGPNSATKVPHRALRPSNDGLRPPPRPRARTRPFLKRPPSRAKRAVGAHRKSCHPPVDHSPFGCSWLARLTPLMKLLERRDMERAKQPQLRRQTRPEHRVARLLSGCRLQARLPQSRNLLGHRDVRAKLVLRASRSKDRLVTSPALQCWPHRGRTPASRMKLEMTTMTSLMALGGVGKGQPRQRLSRTPRPVRRPLSKNPPKLMRCPTRLRHSRFVRIGCS
mmetsp:Transcript_28935/g.66961  ORF Transcript_28935/g.66961 Transcript_28935/m.66961 type:complete len:329 (-) Transcript_28935:651-1637(-)